MRALVALLVLAGWLAVMVLTAPPVAEATTVAAFVATRFAPQLLWASVYLAAVALVLRWPDLGFGRPRPGSLRLLWLPGAYVALFVAVALAVGLPPAATVALVALNALFGAFSEETMFRGFTYVGLRDRLPIWPAIVLTSLLFGAPHVLNGALIGDWGLATAQAAFATLSGITFLALRIRLGSLWPVILLHAAWNTGLVMLGYDAAPPDPDAPIPVAALLLVAAGMLPLFVYPFWLLRRVGRDGDGLGRGRPAAIA